MEIRRDAAARRSWHRRVAAFSSARAFGPAAPHRGEIRDRIGETSFAVLTYRGENRGRGETSDGSLAELLDLLHEGGLRGGAHHGGAVEGNEREGKVR
jgi:hypothetical protein